MMFHSLTTSLLLFTSIAFAHRLESTNDEEFTKFDYNKLSDEKPPAPKRTHIDEISQLTLYLKVIYRCKLSCLLIFLSRLEHACD